MDGVGNDFEAHLDSKVESDVSIRILHLSDSHIGMPNSGSESQESRIKKFVTTLNKELSGKPINLVLLTGDVAYRATSDEYAKFREWVVKPLCASPAFADARWIVVPGNHDVDFSVDYANQDNILTHSGGKLWLPDNEGIAARGGVINRFKPFMEFANSFPPSIGQHWLAGDGFDVTMVEANAGKVLRIISVNTAWCEDRPGKGSQKLAWPGADLLRRALEIGSDAAMTLVLGHHPLAFIENTEKQDIRDLLARNKAVYLHGHSHEPDVSYDIGPASNCFLTLMAHAIDAPPARGMTGTSRSVGYNLIEWDPNDEFLRFSPRIRQGARFALDTTLGKWPTDGDSYRILLPVFATGPDSHRWELGWQDRDIPDPPIRMISAEKLSPYREACSILTDPHRRPGLAVRLEAPLAEGASTVFLQVCRTLVKEGWRVRLQDETDTMPSTLPGELRVIKGSPVLLALRAPRDLQEIMNIASLVRLAQERPVERLTFLLQGDHLLWNISEPTPELRRLFSNSHSITWGLASSAERWFSSATFESAMIDALGWDHSISNHPRWSLLGAIAASREQNGLPLATLVSETKNSLNRNASTATKRCLRIVAAVHGEGKAILTIGTLASILHPDARIDVAIDRLKRDSWSSNLLKFELRLVEREGHTVVLTRHPAAGRVLAEAAGGRDLADVVDAIMKIRRSGGSIPFWNEWIDLAPTRWHAETFLDRTDLAIADLVELTSLANTWERLAMPINAQKPPSPLWRDLYLTLANAHLIQGNKVLSCLAAIAGLRKGPDNALLQPLNLYADVFGELGIAWDDGFLANKALAAHTALTTLNNSSTQGTSKKRSGHSPSHAGVTPARRNAQKALSALACSLPALTSPPDWAKKMRSGSSSDFLSDV